MYALFDRTKLKAKHRETGRIEDTNAFLSTFFWNSKRLKKIRRMIVVTSINSVTSEVRLCYLFYSRKHISSLRHYLCQDSSENHVPCC